MILISNYFIGPTQHIEDVKQELPLVDNRMTYVKDLEGFEYDAQYTYTVENEVNGNQKLTATIEYTETNSLFIDDMDRFWNVTDHQGVEYKVVHIDRQGKGNKMFVQVIAEPLFFYYMERDYLKKSNGSHERFDGHLTAKNAADKLFNDTPFDYVLVDSADSQEWENFGGVDNTKLEMFNRFLNRYQYEFEIQGSTIYFKNRAGRDTSILYAHRFNASDIQQSIDATEQFTAIHGYGDYGDGEGSEDWQDANLSPDYPKSSSKYVAPYISPLASILGVTWGKPITNGNMKRSALEKAMKEAVDTSLKVSVNANIHNLSSQDYPIDQSQAGDRVYLVDERIGLNEEVRIVSQSITRDWQNKVIDANITFGNEGLGKRHQANINSTIKDMSDIFSGKKKLEVTWLPDAVKRASDIINGNIDSFFDYQAGSITGYNRSNPNEFMRFNTDGLGFSRDGGNTYQSAITYEGIVADAITTGTLRSIFIEGVEIYGSYFESSTSDTNYTIIRDSFLESRGQFRRTWKGVTTTHDVKMKLENGYLRARNDNESHSLYFSDMGISTYADATGGESNIASGSLLFRDNSYSGYNSVVLHSYNGVTALKSDNNRVILEGGTTTHLEANTYSVYIRPYKNSLPGHNEFRFWVKDGANAAHTDGVISYGNADAGSATGIRFKKTTTGRPTIYATNGNGDIGSGDVRADRFVGSLAPVGSYAYVRAERTRFVLGDNDTNYSDVQFHDAMANSIRTNTSGNNFYIGTSTGEVRITTNELWNGGYRPIRTSKVFETSSEKYKSDIKRFEGSALNMINQSVIYDYEKDGIDGRELGFIIEREMPSRLINGDAVDGYSHRSLNTLAIQELDVKLEHEIKALKERLAKLEGVA